MAPNPSNSSNLEQLALKGLNIRLRRCHLSTTLIVRGAYLDTFVRAADEQSVSLIHGDWNHDDERARPDGHQHTIRVRDGLPAARVQRATDGEVAFQRYGDQRQSTHPDWHSCVANTSTRNSSGDEIPERVTSLYFATPLAFNPPPTTEGFPWDELKWWLR